MTAKSLAELLNEKVEQYNRPSFIPKDPICIPHSFSQKQDIEISGFFAALFAWGQRTTIINKSKELMTLMDNAPYDFIINHSPKDRKKFLEFKHRTFQAVDIIFLISFLQKHYNNFESLEDAFLQEGYAKTKTECTIQEMRLRNFYEYVFSHEHLDRSHKHIATPAKNSACKRLNMFLRWMVRKDKKGVDFGIWNKISPAELIIPFDVHVCRVANKLHLLSSEKSNWNQATSLTEQLKTLDETDPIKYDFALFGMGVLEEKI